MPSSKIEPPSPVSRAAELDIRAFTDAKKPKSDVQFAAVAAYYYRFEAGPGERRESIDSEILLEATRLAGRHRLAAPGKTLHNAKSIGYLEWRWRREVQNQQRRGEPGGDDVARCGDRVPSDSE